MTEERKGKGRGGKERNREGRWKGKGGERKCGEEMYSSTTYF